MTEAVAENRSKLIAQGSHPFDLGTVVASLASIHEVLRATLGRTCRVHALFNAADLPYLCRLEDFDESLLESLFEQYPASDGQPLLNASLTYQTRTRVAQGSFHFDQTINSMHLSLEMPPRGLPRKHVISLAEAIIEPLDPQWVIYQNRLLIDALYGLYPRYFRTAWLTYHTGMLTDELPEFWTQEMLDTSRGTMAVAKPKWFAKTDPDLLDELVDLDQWIEDECPYL